MALAAFKPILTLSPYHLISWGSLLGMELYQSFVMTKLCYRHLPRPQFTSLQKRVFPVYFSMQLGLVLVTALTHPPRSIVSLIQSGRGWSEWAPLALNALMAGLNAVVYGPRTSKTMMERTHQETRESRLNKESPSSQSRPPTPSADMTRTRKAFSHSHAMTIHLNAIAMIATVWYGVALAGRMEIGG